MSCCNIRLRVEEPNEIVLTLGGVSVISSALPAYAGPYEVTPSSSEQVLETDNRRMTDDVTVHEVPFSSVSNPYGGETATIL